VSASKRGTPKFGAPSADVREAKGTIDREHLAHALLAHFDPARLFQPSERYESALQTIGIEREKRLSVLYNHYSIDTTAPNAGVILAYCLACDFIPHFDPMETPRPRGMRGRPKSVEKKHLDLVGAILKMTETQGVTIIQACRKLSKQTPPWKGIAHKQLQRRYYLWADAVRAKRAEPIDRSP
jgi:hypothetical protein